MDRELKQKIESERPFRIPNYRTGDVLEVSVFNSLSEKKFNTYKGVVIGQEKKNNLRHQFKMHFNTESVGVSLKVKAYSPMVAKIDIATEGSHKNRAKLPHIPELELTKNQL